MLGQELEPLKREQTRLSDELAATNGLLEVAVAGRERLEATVREAVRRSENGHASYLQAGPAIRRLMNQAFFKRVLVTEDGVAGWEYNEPFATLMSAHSGAAQQCRLLIEHEDDGSGRGEGPRHSLGCTNGNALAT